MLSVDRIKCYVSSYYTFCNKKKKSTTAVCTLFDEDLVFLSFFVVVVVVVVVVVLSCKMEIKQTAGQRSLRYQVECTGLC